MCVAFITHHTNEKHKQKRKHTQHQIKTYTTLYTSKHTQHHTHQEASGFYKMSAEDRMAILSAKDSSEVPVKVRNRLYAALGRLVKSASHRVSPAFLQKWQAAQAAGNETKFSFLQTWARDTTGSEVVMSERFTRATTESNKEKYSWVTKYDLYAAKQAWANPLQMGYCDKLLAVARTRPHSDPKHKKDSTQSHKQSDESPTHIQREEHVQEEEHSQAQKGAQKCAKSYRKE